MYLLKPILAFFDLVRRDSSPNQLAAGATLGFLLGFTPWLTLQGLALFAVLLLLRVNFGALLVFLCASSILYWCLDPVLNLVGLWLLTGVPGLQSFWVELYSLPLLPLTRFNYSLVMGGLFVGLITALPLYWLLTLVMMVYGKQLRAWGSEKLRQISWGTLRLVRNYAQYLP